MSLNNDFEKGVLNAVISTADPGSPDPFNAVTGAPIYGNAHSRSGLAAKCVMGASGQAIAWALASLTDHYARTYFLIEGNVGNQVDIVIVTGSGSTKTRATLITLAGQNKLKIRDGIASSVQFGTTILLNHLYRLELHYKHGAAGSCQITARLYDGDADTPIETVTPPATWTMGVSASLIEFGSLNGNTDIVWHDNIGAAYVSWPGRAVTTISKNIGAASAGSSNISVDRVIVKSSGAASPGSSNIDKVKRVVRIVGGVSAGSSAIDKVKRFIKIYGATSPLTASATHLLSEPRTLGGRSVGSSNISKIVTYGKTIGAASPLSPAISRGNKARVTWVQLVIPEASTYTYSKTIGGVSALGTSSDRATQDNKIVGAASPGSSGIIPGITTFAKSVGATSPGSGSFTGITNTSRLVGAVSAGSGSASRVIYHVKSSGAISTVSANITKVAQFAKTIGVEGRIEVASDVFIDSSKHFGGESPTEAGIDKLVFFIFSKTVGATSDVQGAVSRGNRARVTWVALVIPPALSNTFSKIIGGVSPGVARIDSAIPSTFLKIVGATSTASTSSVRLLGMPGPWPAPFTYTITSTPQEAFGGTSPATGGSNRVVIFVRPASGAISVSSASIVRNTQARKNIGATSPASPGIGQNHFQTISKSLGAASDAQGAVDVVKRVSKGLGGLTDAQGGTAKAASFSKTLGGVSQGESRIEVIFSTALAKVPGAISAGSSSISKFVTFSKSFGATSDAQGAFDKHIAVTIVGAVSAGSSSSVRNTIYNKSFGATSSASSNINRRAFFSVGIGAISDGQSGVNQANLRPKNIGASSTATGAILETVFNYNIFRVIGGVSKASGSIDRSTITSKQFGAISDAQADTKLWTYYKSLGATSASGAGIAVHAISSVLGGVSVARAGISYRVLFAITPSTKVDYTLLSVDDEDVDELLSVDGDSILLSGRAG